MKKFLINTEMLLTALIALTAIVIGGFMIADTGANYLRLPDSLLTGTPFVDFIIPGIVLCFVIGTANLIAFVSLLKHDRVSISYAMVAGLLLCVLIVAQIILTGVTFWLHYIFLGLGLIVMLVALQLKGKQLI